ncbi:MAG: NYN domain-containing protein [Limimaricola soesokkakensis]|uniref:NYN domain-containing protein n=1 Tax=Limimaricola soesokkakensis TaxID=1343159 RepID=UPI0040597D88
MVAQRTAVLVDGDNMSPRHAARVLVEAGKLGRVDVARVYAAANHPSEWLSTPGYRLMHAGVGKNAADLLLSIDAMELALTGGIDSFLIATSDGDFLHLAQRLRERGLHVLGLGEKKAPLGFRLACTEFLVLPAVKNCDKPIPDAGAFSEFDQKIRDMIAQHSTKGRGMRVAELNPKMHRLHGIRISALPEGNWRAYLSARPSLYALDPPGPEAMVRYRAEGFGQR